jgi:hypothetical protein
MELSDLPKPNKEIRRKLRNPHVKKIVEWELRTGKPTEVYRLDDDGTGNPVFFNVSLMKEWAPDNLEIFAMPLDFDRAMDLVKTDAITPGHIEQHTIRTSIQPLIVCRGILGGDRIIDGAHRFVAIHLGAAEFGIAPSIPAYIFQPTQWKKFVIPRLAAKICKFEGA